jgi:hypothetical protein
MDPVLVNLVLNCLKNTAIQQFQQSEIFIILDGLGAKLLCSIP